MVEVVHVSDLDAVITSATERFLAVLEDVRANGGRHGDGVARVVLTGGGAGIGLLRRLAGEPIDWSTVHVFFGDERNVAVTHPDSNEGQAREALLNHVNIPAENIHGYGLGSISMEESAAAYAEVLEQFAPKGFDLHLLGMGGEGHINSLFPHAAATSEGERLVLPVLDSPKPPAERVTLTLPAVNASERVWLLVAGSEKAEAAAHVINGADPLDWPAAGAQGVKETLLFLAEDARA